MSGNYNSGSGRGQSTPQMSPRELVQLYQTSLPDILGTVLGQAPAGARTLAQTAADVSPIYTESGLNQLRDYGAGYQQAGARLAEQQAASTADLIGGAGARAAIGGRDLARTVNPLQYETADRASELINSINLSGLSPGESNAIERGLNQASTATGNLGNINPRNTITNAMQFGDAMNNKRAALANSLGVANQTAAGISSIFNPIALATGAGNLTNNFGMSQFNPTQGVAAANIPIDTATNFGAQLAGNASAPISTNRQSSSGGGLGCCFIFLESYHGVMPTHIRKCRDHYYKSHPQIATGYKKMAKCLVPLMQRSKIVRELVWNFMVKPLTEYGHFIINRDLTKRKYKIARTFWFSVWNYLGK